MPRECRSAPSQHEIYGAAAIQWPNRPHQTRRWQCNVPIKGGIATDRPFVLPYPASARWYPGNLGLGNSSGKCRVEAYGDKCRGRGN